MEETGSETKSERIRLWGMGHAKAEQSRRERSDSEQEATNTRARENKRIYFEKRHCHHSTERPLQ